MLTRISLFLCAATLICGPALAQQPYFDPNRRFQPPPPQQQQRAQPDQPARNRDDGRRGSRYREDRRDDQRFDRERRYRDRRDDRRGYDRDRRF